MVRLAEGDPLGHQIIRQFGGIGIAALGRRLGAFAIHLEIDQHQGRHVEAVVPGVEGIEQPFLVFLHVLVVGQRQRLQAHQHAHLGADYPASLATNKLKGVRVLLLGHQGRAGGDRIGKLHEARLAGVVEDKIFRKTRQVRHGEGRHVHQLHHVIPIGDRIQTVAGGAAKAHIERQRFPVDGVRRTRQSAAAERAGVEALEGILQTGVIPLQHLHIGQRPVGEGDRLGTLQVGVTRQHCGLVGTGGSDQPLLQRRDGAEQQLTLRLAPELEVGGDLIVARAAGVQLLAQGADGIDELALDPGVDVFGIRAQDLLGILLHRSEQHLHRLLQFALLIAGQYTHLHQRLGPGHGALDILLRQPVIEPQRIVELLEPAIGSLTEASTPKCHTALLECVVGGALRLPSSRGPLACALKSCPVFFCITVRW
ncbi:hypothetical protein D3C87_1080730 [compost metagenome]